MFFKPVG